MLGHFVSSNSAADRVVAPLARFAQCFDIFVFDCCVGQFRFRWLIFSVFIFFERLHVFIFEWLHIIFTFKWLHVGFNFADIFYFAHVGPLKLFTMRYGWIRRGGLGGAGWGQVPPRARK